MKGRQSAVGSRQPVAHGLRRIALGVVIAGDLLALCGCRDEGATVAPVVLGVGFMRAPTIPLDPEFHGDVVREPEKEDLDWSYGAGDGAGTEAYQYVQPQRGTP